MIRRALAVLTVFGAVGLASCESCRDGDFVAELIRRQAKVERDYGNAPEVWTAADRGDRFALGDGLRTGTGAEATLKLPRRARLLVKSDTVIRFKRSEDSASPGEQIEMQRGEVTIDTGELDLGVSTARGVVKITPNSRVRMRSEPQKTRFDVVVGRVEYSLDGATRSVPAGEGFDLVVLAASVEKAPTPPPAPALPAESAKTIPDAPAADSGRKALASPGPGFQDPPPAAILQLPAGETAVIHDPAPPTDVRMTFSSCPEQSVLELDRGNGKFDAVRVRGERAELRARIPRGSFKYRLRCVRSGRVQPAPIATGRLTILRDAATRPLPRAAATITADADGRRYTVSYQNRLPKITLRWPNAPRAKSYRLFVRPDKGDPLAVDASRASVTLESGRVGEGLHQFWFETPDKQRSEQGLLEVAFDYAARTAYLTSPLEREARQNGRIRFAGGTLIGSSVQVQGVPQKLDAQGRFSASVEVPAGADGAYVRVQHRSTGIHYYVRHLR